MESKMAMEMIQRIRILSSLVLFLAAKSLAEVPDDRCLSRDDGRPCVFPFSFGGTTYDECTLDGHTAPWCSIQNQDGGIEMQLWDECQDSVACQRSQCTPDLTQEQVDPASWCAGRTWDQDCSLACSPSTSCQCQLPDNFSVPIAASEKLVSFHASCMSWPAAQDFCCSLGGTLWEPADAAELAEVWDSMTEQIAGAILDNCHWWLGLNNWNPPDGNITRYASDSSSTTFLLVTDGPDEGKENCIVTGVGASTLFDQHCGCSEAPLACELPYDPPEEVVEEGDGANQTNRSGDINMSNACMSDLAAEEAHPTLWCNETWRGDCSACTTDYCHCNLGTDRLEVDLPNKFVVFETCCQNWQSAQGRCCEQGGKLWEPQSMLEYEDVLSRVLTYAPQLNITPCHWWIGLNNWNATNNETLAHYASFPNSLAFMMVNDAPDLYDESCVGMYGMDWNWQDWNCGCTFLPFVCELPASRGPSVRMVAPPEEQCPPDVMEDYVEPEIWCNRTWDGDCLVACTMSYCDCHLSSGASKLEVRVNEKRLVFETCCENWPSAQRQCCEMGGKLWEPENEAEYEVALNLALQQDSNLSSDPCHFWIGAHNFDLDGPGQAFYSSNTSVLSFHSLLASEDNHNCVHFNFSSTMWSDAHCGCSHKNIVCELPCEEEDKCLPLEQECSPDLTEEQVDPQRWCTALDEIFNDQCEDDCPGSNNCFCDREPEVTSIIVEGKQVVNSLQCTNWKAAQAICCLRGGRLWEPRSQFEYYMVTSALVPDISSDRCMYWIGAHNWDPERGVYTFYSSDPSSQAIMNVYDGVDRMTQNCVAFGSNLRWYDWHCGCSFGSFICEKEVHNECFDGLTREAVYDQASWCNVVFLGHCCQEQRLCNCSSSPDQVHSISTGFKTIFFEDICTTWIEAQQHCCELGGKLWEPESLSEYDTVVSRLLAINDEDKSCTHWIGVNNWSDLDGNGTVFASSPFADAPMAVVDGEDGNTENCVGIGMGQDWYDWNCGCTYGVPICEKEIELDFLGPLFPLPQ